MASCGFSISDVEIIQSGVIEILKGAYVESLLESQGAKAAAECNSLFSLSGHHSAGAGPEGTTLRAGDLPVAPYGSSIRELSYCKAASVHTESYYGRLDNLLHNTLKKGCGV